MNKLVNTISARLSLREPQRESLEILDALYESVDFNSRPNLDSALAAIAAKYKKVTDFERDFPSLCFALATGVGKTRLMGAFISYLFLSRKSRHFFVLAPNLTIYQKLIADFSPTNAKYVFKGIAEFANSPPVIVTGDNFEQGQGVRLDLAKPGTVLQTRLFGADDTAFINIFNVSKIDTESRKGNSPKIKRLQEYIGESYFDYLSSLPDLVLLMDEAHRYRAIAGAKAINELKPILGLELTATPKSIGQNPQPFKNVIYSYPLAAALRDGFVKEPAVATRKDFRSQDYSMDELEKIKLEDGVHHHEHVKVELQVYANQHSEQPIHPFMLVVAQDTTHAKQLRELIESEAFFDGRYKGRVIEIHSNLRGEESDEATQRLLSVEHDSETEIVIHVNKLKEGWDVTNLYTIVPLRASASEILTEQTIGRGLRLPYGHRTNVETIDRLTIIAHDKFQAIVDAANDPDSIVRKTITIGEGGDVPTEKAQAISVPSLIEHVLAGGVCTEKPLSVLDTPEKREVATIVLDVVRQFERLESSNRLKDADIKQQITQRVKEVLAPAQLQIEGLKPETDVAAIVDVVTQTVAELIIDVPNIVLVPTSEITFGFKDFDLTNLGSIRLQPVSQEILIQHLRTNERSFLLSERNTAREERMEDYLIRSLIDHDEINYDAHADLLYKLAGQLVAHLKTYLPDEQDIENVLIYHQRPLTEFVFAQMMQHYWETPTDYDVKVNRGFTMLRPNNYTMASSETPRDFRAPVNERSRIKSMVFTGFLKCCYPIQKFDSDTERRFAVLLEDDEETIRWMKPAVGHFQIEWKSGQPYQPDFVVETKTEKIICEPKADNEITTEEVQLKGKAASKWCEHASAHAALHGGKPWMYLLIPQSEITANRTLSGLKSSQPIVVT